MKTLYFYSDPNNTASNAMRSEVQASGVPFVERNMAIDPRIHIVSRGGPMVLVDIDGANMKEIPPAATSAEILAAFNSTVAPTPKPIAKIITKDVFGAAKTLFTTNEAIVVRAEIWKPDLSGIMVGFSGTYPVPFFDTGGREYYLKMVFANGVAEVTVAAGKLAIGKYRATKASSTLADVVEHEIIVALNGA